MAQAVTVLSSVLKMVESWPQCPSVNILGLSEAMPRLYTEADHGCILSLVSITLKPDHPLTSIDTN
jgi:hypothetical protein